MRIGYEKSDYPEIRNIINKIAEYEYVDLKKNNVYAYVLFLRRKVKGFLKSYTNLNLYYSYKSIKNKKVDIIHTFNTVVKSNENFVVTFETLCPRYEEFLVEQDKSVNIQYSDMALEAFEALRSPKCKALIAISESAKKIQEEILVNYSYKEEILKKIVVVHPPQKVHCVNLDNRSYDKEIKFIFIGRDFFGKGGEQIIDAFEELNTEDNINFKLIIVSSFSNTNTNRPSNEKEKFYKDKVRNTSYIEYYEEIDNAKVIDLIKQCHIGLLPTWADTYGYSVLEFQACGCPVISTDVRALKEINNEDLGWIIKVDKNTRGEAYFSTISEQEKLKRDIKEQLKEIIKDIYDKKTDIKKKGERCIEKIIEKHNEDEYSKKLKKIYNS